MYSPVNRNNTVDSSLFVEYQFLWISWVLLNHKLKCSTNDTFSIRLYADFGKTTKLDILLEFSSIHENWHPRKINEPTVGVVC